MTRSVVERYWQANADRDFDALGRLRHPEWVAEWPQSGERVPSHENDVRIHERYPGYPAHELTALAGQPEEWALSPSNLPVRVSGAGDLWIAEAVLTYPEGPQRAVSIVELEDGLIRRETTYWATPFEPPAWRAHLVRPIPANDRPRLVHRAAPDEEARHLDAVRRFWAKPSAGTSTEERRALYIEGMRELYHEDAVEDLPQSGERIQGLEAMVDLVEGHPDFPDARLRRILGTGDVVILEASLIYEQGGFWEAVILQFRDDRVAHTTEYYASALEPPAWRTGHVEPIEGTPPGQNSDLVNASGVPR